MSPRPEDSTLSPSKATSRKRLVARLTEAGLPTDCFVDLTGKQSHVDHTDDLNQFSLSQIQGNYGVMPGGNLVFVDIDVPLAGLPSDARDFVSRYAHTLKVKTTHDGLHLWLLCRGEIDNSDEDWGEVRSENWYVVGPGSTLDHSLCDDCEKTGTDSYDLVDGTIQTVTREEIDAITTDSTSEAPEIDPQEVESTFDDSLAGRLGHATSQDEKLNQLFKWACRKGTLDGLPYSDRSSAECALAQKLLWWYEHDVEKVKEILNEIQPPKWSSRGYDYRQSVMQAGLAYTQAKGEKYDPNHKPNGVRLGYAREIVLALADLDTQPGREGIKTREVVTMLNHRLQRRPSLKDSISRRHARKVILALEEDGFVSRHGRKKGTRWFVESLPESDSGFWRQFPTRDEIRRQRREYLAGREL